MPTKTLLFTSFLLILSAQTAVLADYSPPFIDEDIDAAASRQAMKPLLEPERSMIPFSEVESKLSVPVLRADYLLTVEGILDKQEIPGLTDASYLSSKLANDIITYQFSKRIQFSPPAKEESWVEAVESFLNNLFVYQNSYGYSYMLGY